MDNQIRCISHEIRNQVSICELYTQIIKKNIEINSIKNKSIDNALICITRALKLISNNLVDLKSLDNLCIKKCNIKDILKEALSLSTVYIQDKEIEITLSCDINNDIYVDDNKFLACLINIIKNAIEAIHNKGFIKISARNINDFVKIKISNNGEKIPQDVDIFQEGFTTKTSGSGLGLAICKKNLKLMNTDLSLVSSNEKLTEFELTVRGIHD